MTLITSLFNKGIYKNTLKRFKWGSFIYFIMLFFAVPFIFMINTPDELQTIYNASAIPYKNILFGYSNFIFPMLFAIVVPTVVALLLYNYVHSSKHGIFVHSIPATRKANYVSTLAAGFVLMLFPVIANAFILFIMTFLGYSKIFSISAIAYWVLVNAFIVFVMFSIATFSSFLTGNSFAQVAINVIIHTILPIISATTFLLADAFLYGYTNSHGSFAEKLIEYTPIVWIVSTFSNSERSLKAFLTPALWIYAVLGIVMYALAMLLYKKRRIENCGEVAGFKFMKPVLKYTVTSFTAVAAFGILINSNVHWTVVALVSALVCAIAYFACEMILSKTFKVFGSYKGYLGFAGACAVVVVFFAFTSVFGFETRIPEITDIESATMYTYYNETLPVSQEEKSKETVIKYHKLFTENMPVLTSVYTRKSDSPYARNKYINIEYTLKNGKTISRRYLAANDVCDNAISEMFAFNDYKRAFCGIDVLNIENVTNMQLSIELSRFNYSYALNEDAKELLRAIEKDIDNITYEEYNENSPINYRLSLSLSPFENDVQGVFKESKDGERYYRHFDIRINGNFKNAIKYLEEKGYLKLSYERISDCIYISKSTVEIKADKNSYENYKEAVSSKAITDRAIEDCVKLEKEDALQLLNYLQFDDTKFTVQEKEGVSYLFFASESPDAFYYNEHFVSVLKDELPDYLKKYVE